MQAFICVTCGVQFAERSEPAPSCPICDDPRQYVGFDGQQWTTLSDLKSQHKNTITAVDAGIYSIHTEPKFGIGQRSMLVQSGPGNVLWDCVSLLDDATVNEVRRLGGLTAIAISHPHYYATLVEWSRAFGGVPVYLHEDDREWMMRPDPCIRYLTGETHELNAEFTLIRCGGHFEGAQVMHSTGGALFTGDVIQVTPDRRWVGFMRSYPNLIPLPAFAVQRIVDAVEPYAFDIIYGAWPKFDVRGDAKAAVRRSAERYIRALTSL